MYHKVKNTLAGLGFVAAFVATGLLFSEPVPGQGNANPGARLPDVSAEARDTAVALAMGPVRRVSQLHLQSGMPYYSFGSRPTRRQES